MKYYSQPNVKQDKFVIETLNNKKDGFFVDIGCHRPRHINNTYLLEKEFNWRGISIDNKDKHLTTWPQFRDTSMLVCQNALEIDYRELFNRFSVPSVVDYLSMDLNAPVTLEVLYKLPFDDYSFRVITYEHDNFRYEKDYKGNCPRKVEEGKEMPKDASRKYLSNLGYKLIKTAGTNGDQDDFWTKI